MADYKNKYISFGEFENAVNTIVNDSFADDVYSAARSELSKRTIVLQLYAPSFSLSDINNVWSEEAEKILKQLKANKQYKALLSAADSQLAHRLRSIESSRFSATDVLLGNLITAVTERLNETKDFDIETANRFINAIEKLSDPEITAKAVKIINGSDNSEDGKQS